MVKKHKMQRIHNLLSERTAWLDKIHKCESKFPEIKLIFQKLNFDFFSFIFLIKMDKISIEFVNVYNFFRKNILTSYITAFIKNKLFYKDGWWIYTF